MTAEEKRLQESEARTAHWKMWGPYLERARVGHGARNKYPQPSSLTPNWPKRIGSAANWEPEIELIDTGIFDEDRYFDVFVEYAKADVEDILVRINVINRGRRRLSWICCQRFSSAIPGHGITTRRGHNCGASSVRGRRSKATAGSQPRLARRSWRPIIKLSASVGSTAGARVACRGFQWTAQLKRLSF